MTEINRSHVLRRWWRATVVDRIEHHRVIDAVHDDAGWTSRYLFMLTMSAGIAVLGLLLSSPAVVIGAMLISPLMGPIIGLGFALATVDAAQIRRAAVALGAGTLLAVLMTAAITLVSPLQNVTAEIAARTRPNLFDLLVAIFSALAGSYATIRGRAGTIVGVAIATALMPPLATVGFGLATLNMTVFGGALLLFVTNFVAIALTAAVMARLYGFGGGLSPNQTLWQSAAILITFVVLAVPLGIALRQIAWEGVAGRQARTAVASVFPDNARLSQVEVDFAARPIAVTASVFTPRYRADANQAAAAEFARLVGRRASMRIEQYRVSIGDAESSAVQAAQKTATPEDRTVDAIGYGLSLAAGVDANQVLVDDVHHRAFVRAQPLPGAGLAAYHALEQRLSAVTKGWQVVLVPPATPLGRVPFVDETPDAGFLADAAWAAERRDEAITVAGRGDRADAVAKALTDAGAKVDRASGSSVRVVLSWSVPGNS